MIKQFPIIRADVFHKSNVGTQEQRQELIAEAWHHFHNNPKTTAFSNKGCWRSNFIYKDIEWLMQEVRAVVTEAGNFYQKTDPIYQKKTKSFQGSEIKYWTNINKPGSRNSLHEHKLWHYVAVYYLQSEGTGDIVFANPMNITEGCNPYAPFVSTMAFSPSSGDLLIWPAWLPHETEVNTSDQHRINIAMNIRFTAPTWLDDETN